MRKRKEDNRFIQRLMLNGQDVGQVEALCDDGPWRFGRFMPSENFGSFAPYFGRWSLLMHADDDGRRLSREASIELRDAESAIDQLHASLQDNGHPAYEIRQLNIDGPLIEWWEG
jgi:hypothetical protein